MAEVINGYILMAPLANNNAGFSCWTYALRDGKEYFLKEFMNPAYPVDTAISEEQRGKILRICEGYEERMKRFYGEINRVSDGNLLRIKEFFRCDSRYYITTERVIGKKLTPKSLQNYTFETRLLLCKTVAHAVMKLHEAHIVHSDIKWDNVIIKETTGGNLTGKVIDIDDGFFESDPPHEGEELRGDQVYLAPESCLFMCGEPSKLSCKLDVFALGILFHQYLTGELPEFDVENEEYIFNALLNEAPVTVSAKIPEKYRKILSRMLDVDPDRRISSAEVFAALNDRDVVKKDSVPDADTDVRVTAGSFAGAVDGSIMADPKSAFRPARDR